MNLNDLLKDSKPVIENIDYRITKIKEKNDYITIYLDNNEKINVSVDSYFKYGLSSIKGIDQKYYEILKDEERLLSSYNGALRKLSGKDYTVKQIKDYLYLKKQLDKGEVNNIIHKLTEYGLLDDEKYCINRFNYLNSQLQSVKQIKAKLNKEGISQELIDKYVVNNSDDEIRKVNSLAHKYSNSIKNKSQNAIKTTILNKLVSLGYSYDISKQAVNNLNIEVNNEDELLNKEYLKAKTKYSKKYEDYDLKSHIYAYLLSKGFKSEDIKKVMEV